MAAVIGPVGIKYADLRHGRITFFIVLKIILNMEEIFKCHGKTKRVIKLL